MFLIRLQMHRHHLPAFAGYENGFIIKCYFKSFGISDKKVIAGAGLEFNFIAGFQLIFGRLLLIDDDFNPGAFQS